MSNFFFRPSGTGYTAAIAGGIVRLCFEAATRVADVIDGVLSDVATEMEAAERQRRNTLVPEGLEVVGIEKGKIIAKQKGDPSHSM